MCLRFAFLLTTRLAGWLRLSRREEMWKTAEILILRHQLAVLQRRQPRRPKLNWGGPGPAGGTGRRDTESPLPRVAAAGHPGHDRALAARHRPAPLGGAVDARQDRPAGPPPDRQGPGPAAGPGEPRMGLPPDSTGNWPAWESTSRRRPCGRSSRPTASAPRRDGPGQPGRSSCAPRPAGCQKSAVPVSCDDAPRSTCRT